MPSTDGDNAWGGGSSSWFEATPELFNGSANAGYIPTTPQDFVNAHGAANVWVDDQYVAHSSGWGEHKKDVVKLAEGRHKLRVDFWQAGGNSQVQLQWIPAGGGRNWIPAAVMTTPPSADMLARIEEAVIGLSSAKPEEVGAASALLKGYGDVALFFLHRSLRRAPQAVAAIVPVLVEMRDPALFGLIRELRKAESPLGPKIEASLADWAKQGDKSYAAWFYGVMKADQDMEFPVCGRFLSKVLEQDCGKNEGTFNNLVADPQGAATLKAYLDKQPKPAAPPA